MIVRRPNLEVVTKRYQDSFSSMFMYGKASLQPFPVVWIFLLQQMSSQLGSQKLLQGSVSHEFTAYLSVVNLFLT